MLEIIIEARKASIAFGLRNAGKIHLPLFYFYVELDKQTSLGLPKEYEERAVYIIKGSIEVNGRKFESGYMLVFRNNSEPKVKVLEHSTLMLLGGERFI